MLAKSIISDQNFFDEASDRTSSKQKCGRAPGVVSKTKGFYFAEKNMVIAQECLNENRFNFTLFGFKNPDSPTFELVELIIP